MLLKIRFRISLVVAYSLKKGLRGYRGEFRCVFIVQGAHPSAIDLIPRSIGEYSKEVSNLEFKYLPTFSEQDTRGSASCANLA